MLQDLFGGGGKVMTNFDGRSMPQLNRTLISGGGLLNSGDTGETRGMFGGGQRSGFFGGRRR